MNAKIKNINGESEIIETNEKKGLLERIKTGATDFLNKEIVITPKKVIKAAGAAFVFVGGVVATIFVGKALVDDSGADGANVVDISNFIDADLGEDSQTSGTYPWGPDIPEPVVEIKTEDVPADAKTEEI